MQQDGAVVFKNAFGSKTIAQLFGFACSDSERLHTSVMQIRRDIERTMTRQNLQIVNVQTASGMLSPEAVNYICRTALE